MKQREWGAELIFAVVLLLFAAGLRFAGLGFGQPDPIYFPSYAPRQMVHPQIHIHPDEYEFVAIPLEMVVRDQLDLDYEYPSFTALSAYLTYRLTDASAGITLTDREGVGSRSYAPFPLYVIVRTYSALAGVFTVAGAYALGRCLGGQRAAAIAGLLTAASLTMVQHSHYATSSSMAAAFTVLGLWTAVMALRSGRPIRWLVPSSAAMGLAASSRFQMAVAGVVPLLVGLILLGRTRTRQQAWAVLMAWLAAPLAGAIGSPWVVLGFRDFLRQMWFFVTQYSGYGVYADPAMQTPYGLLFELRYLALLGVGLPAALAAILGLAAGLSSYPGLGKLLQERGRFLPVSIILAFLVVYAALVLRTTRPLHADQLLVPFIPAVTVLAGMGAAWLIERLPLPPAATPALVVLLAVWPLTLSVPAARLFTQPDTRDLMLAWIHKHIPLGSTFYLHGSYNLALDEGLYPHVRTFGGETIPLGDLLRQGVAYVLVSDIGVYDLGRASEFVAESAGAEARAYQEELARHYPVLARIERPAALGRDWFNNTLFSWHNPTLTLYCLTDAACAAVR